MGLYEQLLKLSASHNVVQAKSLEKDRLVRIVHTVTGKATAEKVIEATDEEIMNQLTNNSELRNRFSLELKARQTKLRSHQPQKRIKRGLIPRVVQYRVQFKMPVIKCLLFFILLKAGLLQSFQQSSP